MGLSTGSLLYCPRVLNFQFLRPDMLLTGVGKGHLLDCLGFGKKRNKTQKTDCQLTLPVFWPQVSSVAGVSLVNLAVVGWSG